MPVQHESINAFFEPSHAPDQVGEHWEHTLICNYYKTPIKV